MDVGACQKMTHYTNLSGETDCFKKESKPFDSQRIHTLYVISKAMNYTDNM